MPLLSVCVQPRSDRESKGPRGRLQPGCAFECSSENQSPEYTVPLPARVCGFHLVTHTVLKAPSKQLPPGSLHQLLSYLLIPPFFKTLRHLSFLLNPPWSEPHSLVCICFSNYFLVVRVSFVPEKTQRPLDMASC